MQVVNVLLALTLLLSVTVEVRIKPNQSAKVEFKRENPCPAIGARTGYGM